MIPRLLVLQCTYRLNADFAVEAIETLLSSTFIDQDFFKPTMARYHQEALSGRVSPLRLPVSLGARTFEGMLTCLAL